MRHFLLLLLPITLAAPAPAAPPELPPPSEVAPPTVSRETTYYLGPLDEQGYVDYAAALDAAFGDADAKPEDNAFAGILEQLDTSDWPESHLVTLRERLELEAAPEDTPLFVAYHEFAAQRGVDHDAADNMFFGLLDEPLNDEAFPLMIEWFEQVQGPLDAIAEAVRRSKYFAPSILLPDDRSLISVLLPHLGPHRMVGRTFALRIKRSLADSDLDAAVEDLLTPHRLARLQTREPSLISSLVGISIHALAHDSFRSLMNHENLTKAHVARLRKGFEGLPEPRPIMLVLSGGERVIALDAVQQMSRGRVGIREILGTDQPHPRPLEDPFVKLMRDPRFDQNKMLRRINAFWSEHVPPDMDAEVFAKSPADLDELIETIRPSDDEFLQLVLMGQSGIPADEDAGAISSRLGETILGLMTPALSEAVNIHLQNHAMHVSEEVALALAAYRLDKGRYPPLLLSLVPEYLDELPGDPFSDKSLIYRAEGNGYLLYSISSDQEDDGGLDGRSGDADLVIRVSHE